MEENLENGQQQQPSIQDFMQGVRDSGSATTPQKNSFSAGMDNLFNTTAQQVYAEPTKDWMSQITDAKAVGTRYSNPDVVDKFLLQPNFNGSGFNPLDPTNEQRAVDAETWSSAMGKAFDSFGYRFGNQFKDYWADYGRMGSAIVNMDWSKMRMSESDTIDQYYRDQRDSNRNFVFASKEDEEGIFNKKFAADFISNSGFALGTFAGLGLEIAADLAITSLSGGTGGGVFAGLGSRLLGKKAAKEAVKEGAEAAAKVAAKEGTKNSFAEGMKAIGKGFTGVDKTAEEITALAAKNAEEASKLGRMSMPGNKKGEELFEDIFNATSEVIDGGAKSKSIGEYGMGILKAIPGIGTVAQYGEKIAAGARAGASGLELTGMALGSVRRIAQEVNFSASEANFEAVTSYGDQLKNLMDEYRAQHNGAPPPPEEFEDMRKNALKTSAANYNTNMALLMISNGIQFGNLFNKFAPASKFVRDFLSEAGERVVSVETKALSQGFRKTNIFGTLGIAGKIANEFGKKEALYQVGRSFVRNMAKFEITEGLQENLQEVSSNMWKDYYKAQHDHTVRTLSDAAMAGVESQMNMQGFKTFLSGALTGSVIRIPTVLSQRMLAKTGEMLAGDEYKQSMKQFDAELAQVNAFLKGMSKGTMAPKMVNFATQVEAAGDQTEAAAQGKRYEFENASDNVLWSALSAAKRTNMLDPFIQGVRNSGTNMSEEDFQKQYGIDIKDTKYSTPAEFTASVARDIETYAKTIDNIRDQVGTMVNPHIYEKDSENYYAAQMMRMQQEEMVHNLAMNVVKGKMTQKRAEALTEEMRQIPALMQSHDFIARVAADPAQMQPEIGNIKAEMRTLSAQLKDPAIDAVTKQDIQKQLDAKKKKLNNLEKWRTRFWSVKERKVSVKDEQGNPLKDDQGNEVERTEYEPGEYVGSFKKQAEVKAADGTVTTPAKDAPTDEDLMSEDAVTTFRELVNAFNEESGNNIRMSEAESREAFRKFVDYMRLDRDTKAYIKSVDLLANPQRALDMLFNMMDGNFKFRLLQYVDSFERELTTTLLNFTVQNKLSVDDFMKISAEVSDHVKSSEPYLKLVAMTIDPKAGANMADFATKKVKELMEVVEKKLEEVALRYNKAEDVKDISDADYEAFKKDGSISKAASELIARNLLAKNQITERMNEMYKANRKVVDDLMDQLQEEADKAKAEQAAKDAQEKAQREAEARAAEEEAKRNAAAQAAAQQAQNPPAVTTEVETPPVNTEFVEPVDTGDRNVGPRTQEEIEAEAQNATEVVKATFMPRGQTAAKQPGQQPAGKPGETNDNDQGVNDLAAMLRKKREQQENQTPSTPSADAYGTQTNPDGTHDVVEIKTGTVVQKAPSSEKANELAKSENDALSNVTIATQMLKDAGVTNLTVEMMEEFVGKSLKDMRMYNLRNNQAFENLQEYAATRKGQAFMEKLAKELAEQRPPSNGGQDNTVKTDAKDEEKFDKGNAQEVVTNPDAIDVSELWSNIRDLVETENKSSSEVSDNSAKNVNFVEQRSTNDEQPVTKESLEKLLKDTLFCSNP